jgi:cytochrome b561
MEAFMATRVNAEGYDATARWLHWLTVVLVTILVVTGKSGIDADEPGSRAFFWHSSLGVLLAFVAAVRVVWALVHPGPALPVSMSRMNRLLARATHAALYLLVFALPVSGWLAATAEGATVSVFGAASLPRWELPQIRDSATVVRPQPAARRVETDAGAGKGDAESSKDSMEELHEALGNLLLIVAGLHILAVLVHQFYWRDGILQRMLPRRTRVGTRPM